jgi:hypothetical protein
MVLPHPPRQVPAIDPTTRFGSPASSGRTTACRRSWKRRPVVHPHRVGHATPCADCSLASWGPACDAGSRTTDNGALPCARCVGACHHALQRVGRGVVRKRWCLWVVSRRPYTVSTQFSDSLVRAGALVRVLQSPEPPEPSCRVYSCEPFNTAVLHVSGSDACTASWNRTAIACICLTERRVGRFATLARASSSARLRSFPLPA